MDNFDTNGSLSALLDEEEATERTTLMGGTAHARGVSDMSFFFGGPTKKQHHRRKTSLGHASMMMLKSLGMKEAAVDVKDAFKTEMKDAKEGRLTFLDTSMMRSLSVLPEDLGELLEEAIGDYHNNNAAAAESSKVDEEVPTKDDTEHTTTTTSLAPYFALLGAVLAVASNGPSLAIMVGVTPTLKQYWRMVATALCLSGHAMCSFWRDGLPTLTVGQWTTMGLAVLCYVFQNLFFTMAITYTSVSNVVVFANSQALILLAGKALTGGKVLWMEALGAIVAFGGAILCATDNQTAATVDKSMADQSWIGDSLAMASALLGVGYLTFAKAVRSSNVGVIPFMWIMMLSGSCIVLLVMILITKEEFTVSTNATHGLFGWLNPRADRIGVELWIVLVVNCVGAMGFVRAMAHFEPVIIAVATLLEPVCATFIAVAASVGFLPGIKGWVGNLIVAAGTLAVVYPSATASNKKGAAAGQS